MSDGPIPVLGPNDLKFTAEPSDFTGLVTGELGPLGTDQDGFDEVFNETATLAASAGPVLDSLDQDLADASAFLPEFDPAVATNLQFTLQPASDAADAALAVFNVAVPPDPTGGTTTQTGCKPGTVHSGLTIGKKDPTPYPKVNVVPPYTYSDSYPVMCTGDTPVTGTVQSGTFTIDRSNYGTAELIHGDPAIFSMKMVKLNDAGKSWLEHVDLTVTPAKEGRFTAVIYYNRNGGNQFGGQHTYAYNVTIVKP
jgi:hypothetical protein